FLWGAFCVSPPPPPPGGGPPAPRRPSAPGAPPPLPAADWIVRLGDGTEESARRMQAGYDEAGPWLGELAADTSADALGGDAAGAAAELRQVWEETARAAGLTVGAYPEHSGAGRSGERTEHLAPLLEELQSVARAHPGAAW
ncbi:Phenylacetic acid catabolic protein, partial [Streptomyces albidoflavus]